MMKSFKGVMMRTKVLLIVLCLSMATAVTVGAHTEMLDISYDDCTIQPEYDGVGELWYVLSCDDKCYHLPHNEMAIYYYFEEETVYEDGTVYTWATTIGAPAEAIKDAYAESMKKWNDVYFYTYNSSGTITKNKLINIYEGTENYHNLSIFPDMLDAVATTAYIDENGIPGDDAKNNTHFSEWIMWVDVCSFFSKSSGFRY